MPLRDKLRREGPALAGVLVCVIAGWAPVVAGVRSVGHYDLFHEHIPFRAFAMRSLAAGELPLWAPGQRGGYPLHCNGEAGLFSPVEAPLRLAKLPAHRASDWTFVLASLLASGFAYALGRALGMRPAAAALTAIAYGLSGRLVASAWPNAAVVAGLAPALLLALERVRREPSALGPPLGVALALGAILLAGRPQSLVPLLLLAGATVLGAGLSARLRAVVLGVGLGFGLGAPQSVPTLSLVQESARASGMSAEDRAEGSVAPSDLGRVALALGDRKDWPESRAHVGLVTLGLALAALLRERRSRFFVGAAAVAVLLALGPATPLFALAGHLPVLGSLRVPARFLLVASLGLAVAGGLGLDALVERRALRLLAVLLVALELVVSAWATIPWTSPEVYTARPRIVAELEALPSDASGARPRFLGRESFSGYAAVVGLADGRAIEERDALGGDRALVFGLDAAWGYGEPVPEWQEAFVPNTARRLATLGVSADLAADPPRIAQHRMVVPRALVLHDAVAATSAEEARALLEQVDPSKVVVVEDPPPVPATPPHAPLPARIVESSANRVVVAASAPGPAWLVLHDAWDADWSATVNGEATRIHRAHGFFRAIRIPAGESRVEFRYWPASLTSGLAVFALSALAVLLAAAQRLRKSAVTV